MSEKFFSDIYLNPKDNASYSRGNRFEKKVKDINKKINKNAITDYLLAQPNYTLFKPRIKKFPRRKINKISPFETLASDLADFQKLKNYNKGFSWLLLNVCIYSNFIICRPIKQKSKICMTQAFTEILDEIQTKYHFNVKNIWSDRGKIIFARKFACIRTQICMYLHANLRVNTRKIACKYTQICVCMRGCISDVL